MKYFLFIAILIQCLVSNIHAQSFGESTPFRAASYKTTIISGITNGFVAWYKLNGDFTDSINANNGTATGSPSFVTGENGAANGAISLNGSSQYITTTTLGNFGSSIGSGFTICAWAKTTYTSDFEAIFGSLPGSGTGLALYYNYGSGGVHAGYIEIKLFDEIGNQFVGDVTTNTGVADGNWHFVAWTQTTNTASIQIYVDAVSMTVGGGGGVSSTFSNLSVPMGIGFRNGFNDGFFNGQIDDLRIYNIALTQAQISALYSAGAAFYLPEQKTILAFDWNSLNYNPTL